MSNKNRIPHKFLPWIAARKKYKLSHAQIQMARELGMNPKGLGGFVPNEKQPGKMPLPQYIEMLYAKQFRRPEPKVVKTMEELAAEHLQRRAEKKALKLASLGDDDSRENTSPASDSEDDDLRT